MGINVSINQQEVERQKWALASLLVNSPDMRKKIRKLIQSELTKARTRTSRDVKTSVPVDPRQAFRSVKRSVWKKTLGGSLSILAPRRAGAPKPIDIPRKLDRNPGQRGGNRVKRSATTERMLGYYGKDRGFILRFLNAGTDERTTRLGKRGSIAPRNFFEAAASANLDIAAENLGKMIDEELAAAFEKAQKS